MRKVFIQLTLCLCLVMGNFVQQWTLESAARRILVLVFICTSVSQHATSIYWWECSDGDEFWLGVMMFCSLWTLCSSCGYFPTENFELLVKMWPGGSHQLCFCGFSHRREPRVCSWNVFRLWFQLSISSGTNDRANATKLDVSKWKGRKRGQIWWIFIPNHPKKWCILVFLSSEISKKLTFPRGCFYSQNDHNKLYFNEIFTTQFHTMWDTLWGRRERPLKNQSFLQKAGDTRFFKKQVTRAWWA